MKELSGVRIESKGKRPRYGSEKEFWHLSGDVTTYNLYEQSFEALEANGLDHLFESQAEFEARKAEAKAKAAEAAREAEAAEAAEIKITQGADKNGTYF
jgi:transposase